MARTTAADGATFETLVLLLRKVGSRIDGAVRAALSPLDIAPRDYALLSVLAEDGAISQQQASAAIGVDRTTMVAMVDRLEAAEMVKRERHPSDRRTHRLVISSAGEKRRKQALRALTQCEGEILGDLSEKDVRRLMRTLADLAGVESDESVSA